MSCYRIDRGSQVECEELPEVGTRARLVLINFRDVKRISESGGIITAIELFPGRQGYEFLGFRSDVKKSEDVMKTNRKNQFRHNVGFVIYERDQIQKNNIRKITRGRFLALVESKGRDDDSIELIGKNVGLQIVGGVVRDAYENGGVFSISLSTPENGVEYEKKLPQTVGTSYDNGLLIIDQVLNPELVMSFDLTIQFPFDSDTLFSFDEQ